MPTSLRHAKRAVQRKTSFTRAPSVEESNETGNNYGTHTSSTDTLANALHMHSFLRSSSARAAITSTKNSDSIIDNPDQNSSTTQSNTNDFSGRQEPRKTVRLLIPSSGEPMANSTFQPTGNDEYVEEKTGGNCTSISIEEEETPENTEIIVNCVSDSAATQSPPNPLQANVRKLNKALSIVEESPLLGRRVSNI